MIYSGKESQTVSNGHDNGAIPAQASTAPLSAPVPAPVLTREISMWTEASSPETPSSPSETTPGVYYNPRFDPKNFHDGPLSLNPATRLRQMLARPGIVVSVIIAPSRYNMLKVRKQIAPGICDGISARCALEAGFDCLYQRFVYFACTTTSHLTDSLSVVLLLPHHASGCLILLSQR